MAVTTTTQVLHEGLRNAVVQLTGVVDGVNSNELNVNKVDVTALFPSCVRVNVLGITHTIKGGYITLAWDALDPIPFAQLEGYNELKYDYSGGIANDRNVGTNNTGNINLTTHGNVSYTIELKLKKKYK